MGCLHGGPTCVNSYYAVSAALLPWLSVECLGGPSKALQNECLIKLCTLICNFIHSVKLTTPVATYPAVTLP